jgi:hypothetical protein
MLGQGIRGDIGGRAVSSPGHTMMSVRGIRGSGSLPSRDALGRAVSSPLSSKEIMSTHGSSEPSEVSTPHPRSNQSGASLSKSVYMETAGAPAYTCPQSQLLPGIIFETGKIILLLMTASASARFQLPHPHR